MNEMFEKQRAIFNDNVYQLLEKGGFMDDIVFGGVLKVDLKACGKAVLLKAMLVLGCIRANCVLLIGRVVGDVFTQELKLNLEAIAAGIVCELKLNIEDGACFHGKCKVGTGFLDDHLFDNDLPV